MALTDNIIAYWKFQWNSTDEIGSFNGTDTSITYSTWNWKIGQWAWFNGSSSSISIGSTFMNNLSAGTISCWINRSATWAQHTIIDKTQTGTANYVQFIVDSDDKLRMILNNTASVKSTGTISTGWTHVWVTFNGSNCTFYINGSSSGSPANTSTSPNTSRTPFIGKVDNNTAWMNGAIDELWVWSRALSASEFTELYNSGNWLTYPFTSAFRPKVIIY